MQKDSNLLPEIKSQLIDMGYSEDVILLALQKARTNELQEICEILADRGEHFQSIIDMTKPKIKEVKPNKSDFENKKEKPKRIGRKEKARKASEKEQKEEKREPLAQLENRKEEENGKEDQDEEEEEDYYNYEKKNKKKEEVKVNENKNKMDELSIKYVESVRQIFPRLKSKDPNWLITEINDQLKSLKFKTTEGATRVMRYLESREQYPKLVEFKKTIYQFLVKIFDMRIQPKLRVRIQELESAISNAFEMNILNHRQMKAILACYPKFCLKLMAKPNEEMLEKLNKIYAQELAKTQDPNMINGNDEEIQENGLGEEIGGINEEVDQDIIQAKEKELCIICLTRVREIVFLPCSHFLACPLCCQKVRKCPICNDDVQKCLKLYWS